MKFVVAAVFCVIMAALFHMIFIMVDYGFNNPTGGGFVKAQEILDDMLRPEWKNWMHNNSAFSRSFFGMGRFILIAMCVVCFCVEALAKPKVEG